MTNYTRFETDDPRTWQLVDLDAPATSPTLLVEGSDEQADEVAAALNATASAPDLTALREAVEAYRIALSRIDALAREWDANRLGSVAFQRQRWLRLGEIAHTALALEKDGTP